MPPHLHFLLNFGPSPMQFTLLEDWNLAILTARRLPASRLYGLSLQIVPFCCYLLNQVTSSPTHIIQYECITKTSFSHHTKIPFKLQISKNKVPPFPDPFQTSWYVFRFQPIILQWPNHILFTFFTPDAALQEPHKHRLTLPSWPLLIWISFFFISSNLYFHSYYPLHFRFFSPSSLSPLTTTIYRK